MNTSVRTAALATVLLGAGGLAGFTVPSAQAAPVRTCTVSHSAPVRVAGRRYLRDAEPSVSAAVVRQVQRTLTSTANRRAESQLPGITTFPVRAHILKGTRRHDRRHHATKRQVRQQIAYLNLAYAGGEAPAPGLAADTGVRFKLKSISTTTNNSWFHQRTNAQFNQMKRKLHRGNRRTLNIYFVKLPGGLLGRSAFPWSARSHLRGDGVVMAYNSIRGGTLAPYNEGDTLVHETGHWLGLFHTFQGYDGIGGTGCDGAGDEVDDTPAEASPQYRCDPVDTCPAPGVDPIHNFMDYSLDSCMYMFTPGQAARIQAVIAAYRS